MRSDKKMSSAGIIRKRNTCTTIKAVWDLFFWLPRLAPKINHYGICYYKHAARKIARRMPLAYWRYVVSFKWTWSEQQCNYLLTRLCNQKSVMLCIVEKQLSNKSLNWSTLLLNNSFQISEYYTWEDSAQQLPLQLERRCESTRLSVQSTPHILHWNNWIQVIWAYVKYYHTVPAQDFDTYSILP